MAVATLEKCACGVSPESAVKTNGKFYALCRSQATWYHVPPKKEILREWERELIYRWRSPFNKECVQWYGMPFGKEVFINGKQS